ncbi:MAG: Ig-like domain repeat protein [Candidatus Dormibacteraeota bacterium]|uniref:Ig-like domain repeat protein n=1 Tax=Candidatus Amunia macphersoniae TaxID=3127014 RepID=A0A934KPR4_9BACT|nr:Ig-like domain repeat protein [Candidatus Dormibacteraeota bacterium]
MASGAVTITGTSITDAPLVAVALSYEGPETPVPAATLTGLTITHAGFSGAPAIQVAGNAYQYSTLTIQNNTIVNSGNGGAGYPAMSLNRAPVDFGSLISGNQGRDNYLDAISCAWCSAGSDISWVGPTNSSSLHPLGYVLEAGFPLHGNTMTVPANGVVKMISGGITGGRVVSTAGGAIFTSLADNSVAALTCPSVLVKSCTPSPGDWDGLYYTGAHQSGPVFALSGVTIRYAAVGVDIEFPNQTLPPGAVGGDAALSNVVFEHDHGAVAGVLASVAIDGGSVSDITTNSNPAYPTYPPQSAAGFGVDVSGNVRVTGVVLRNVQGIGIGTRGDATVTGNSLDHVATDTSVAIGAQGDGSPSPPQVLAIHNNTITNSGKPSAPSAAIALSYVTGDIGSIVSGNQASGNSVDGIGLTSVIDPTSLTWISVTNSSTLHPLGYFGTLTMEGRVTLTIPAGAVVKGVITIHGGRLDASAGGATFASPGDDTVAPSTCSPSASPDCIGMYRDSNLITVSADSSGHLGDAAISNASMRNSLDPAGVRCGAVVSATSRATSTVGSSAYGVVLSGVTIVDCNTALDIHDTPTSVTGGSMTGGGRGIDSTGPSLSVTGVHFSNMYSGVEFAAPGAGSSVAVSDSAFDHVRYGVDVGATSVTVNHSTFTNGNQPVMVSGSPSAPTNVDLSKDFLGNTGASNTVDSISLSLVTITKSFTWQAATNSVIVHPLYFVAAGRIIIEDATMTMPANTSFPVSTDNFRYAALAFYGGMLDARAGGNVFGGGSCPRTGTCNWAGISLGSSLQSNNPPATAALVGASIEGADVGISTVSGASATLTCSQLSGNVTGASSNSAGITISQSNLTGQTHTGADVAAGVATDARNNWWGQPQGPRPGQKSGPVDATSPLGAPPACAPPPPFQTTTTTSVTGSPNPAVISQTITITASISPIPDGGTVAFSDDGASFYSCGAVPVDLSNGTATCTTTYNNPGSHYFVARYSSDGDYAASNGSTTEKVNADTSPDTVYTTLASPQRMEDTRTDGKRLAAGGTVDVQVAGGTTGVPIGATSVVLNVTSVNNTGTGYLQVYPRGTSSPASAVNYYFDNQVTMDLATVPVDALTGMVTVKSSMPDDVVVDEFGYYQPGSGTAGRYTPLQPQRLCDTRGGSFQGCPGASTQQAGSVLHVQVTSPYGQPSGVTAVVLNVTVADAPNAGWVQAYKHGGARPVSPPTSNVNFNGASPRFQGNPCSADGTGPSDCQITANRVIVPVDSTGGVDIYTSQGPLDLIVDLNGVFTDGTASSGQTFHAITETRLRDTRSIYQPAPIGPHGSLQVQVAGTGAGNTFIPSEATAVVLTVTVDKTYSSWSPPHNSGPSSGFLTVYPGSYPSSPPPPPLASDLNFPPSSIVPAQVYATIGNGYVTIYNGSDNYIDVIVDAYGYFH